MMKFRKSKLNITTAKAVRDAQLGLTHREPIRPFHGGWGVIIARNASEAPRASFKYPTYQDAREVFEALTSDMSKGSTIALTNPNGDVIIRKSA